MSARKGFADELYDFMQSHNLDLIDRSTSATIQAGGSEKDWTVHRYGEEGKEYTTLNGALKSAAT